MADAKIVEMLQELGKWQDGTMARSSEYYEGARFCAVRMSKWVHDNFDIPFMRDCPCLYCRVRDGLES